MPLINTTDLLNRIHLERSIVERFPKSPDTDIRMHWNTEYTQGYVDGMYRAHELINEDIEAPSASDKLFTLSKLLKEFVGSVATADEQKTMTLAQLQSELDEARAQNFNR